MGAEDLQGRLGLDVTDFKTAISTANRELRVLESGFRASAAALGDWASDASGLELRIESLNKQISIQQGKVTALTAEYERVAAEKGETSRAAEELRIKLNKEQETLGKMTNELGRTESALTEMGSESTETASDVEKLDNASEDAASSVSGFSTVIKGLGAVAAVGVAAVAALAAALGAVALAAGKMVIDAAAAADELVTMSSKTGISVERLQELQYIGDQTGVSLDTITGALARLTRSMGAVQNGTQSSIDAFDALGVSVFDSNGNLRDSEDVLNDAITALGGIENASERDALSMELFGRSAMELNPLIKAGNEELARMAEEAHAVGAVMSEENVYALEGFNDQLDSMKAAFKGVLGVLATAFLPTFKRFVDWVRANLIPIMVALGEGIGKAFDFLRKGDIASAIGIIGVQLSKFLPPKLVVGLIRFGKVIQTVFDGIRGMLRALLKGDIGGIFDALADTLFELTGNKKIGMFFYQVGAVVTKLAGIIGAFVARTLKALQGWLAVNIPKALKTLSGFWTGTLLPALQTFWDWLKTRLFPALQELWDFYATYLPPVIQAFADFWNDTLLPTIRTLADYWNRTLKPKLNELIKWLGKNIPLAISTLVDWWENTLIPAYKKLVDYWTTTLQPALAGLWAWLVTNIPAAIQVLVDFWNNTLLPIFSNLVDYWTTSLQPALAELWAWLMTNIPAAIQVLVSSWNGTLLPAFKNLVDYWNSTLKPAIIEQANSWRTVLLPALQEVWSFIQVYLAPLLRTIAELLMVVVGLAVTILAGLIQNILMAAMQALGEVISYYLKPALLALYLVFSTMVNPAIIILAGLVKILLLPVLKLLADFWRDTLGPAITKVKENVLDKLPGAFDAIKTAIGWLIGKLNALITKLKEIKLPDWLTPGSPTPFELGLRGIAKAMDEINRVQLPTLTGNLGGGGRGGVGSGGSVLLTIGPGAIVVNGAGGNADLLAQQIYDALANKARLARFGGNVYAGNR